MINNNLTKFMDKLSFLKSSFKDEKTLGYIMIALIVSSLIFGKIISTLIILLAFLLVVITSDKSSVKNFFIFSLIRIFIIVFLSSILSFDNYDTFFKINVDQHFYVSTAEDIAQNIKSYGIFINYHSIVGLHNVLYNVLGGFLFFLNRQLNIVSIYQSLNFLFHTVTIVTVLKIYDHFLPKEHQKRSILLFVLNALPSFLIFSVFVLREMFLIMVVTAFFYSILLKKPLIFIVSFIASYYLREQIVILYVLSLLSGFLISKFLLTFDHRRGILKISVFVVTSIVVYLLLPKVFPKYAYVIEQLSISNLIKYFKEFTISIFSLSFLFTNLNALPKPLIMLFKLVTPEVFILPFLLLLTLFNKKRKIYHTSFFWIITIFLIIYTFSYFVEYGTISTRYYLVFYPLTIVYIFIDMNKPRDNWIISTIIHKRNSNK